MNPENIQLGDTSLRALISSGVLRRSHLNENLQERFRADFDAAERLRDAEEAVAEQATASKKKLWNR